MFYFYRLAMIACLLCYPLAFAAMNLEKNRSQEIIIDVSRTVGPIKPLIDVNNGPICLRSSYFDLTSYYRQLGVRFVRLHDTSHTFDAVVDMHHVFPNLGANPNRAKNYNFKLTDYYLKTLAAENYQIIYRLGYSIEWDKFLRTNNVPPKSFEKWAEACAHIVRHYNQGWADGMKLGIKYWEVWNEPDLQIFWTGTIEEYLKLYEMTARAIKAVDPSVKVGGPTLAEPTNSPFLELMLKYCRERQVPLDFVSWHIYTWDSKEVFARANHVQAMMAKYGFANAESILDEWNFRPKNFEQGAVENVLDEVNAGSTNFKQLDKQEMFTAMGGMPGASFIAAVLIRLQDTPVSIAPFYVGTTKNYGLFNQYGKPQKAYFSFLALRRLLECPERLMVANQGQADLPVLAGISADKKMARVLMSNPSTESNTVHLKLENLPWAAASCEKHLLSNSYNLQSVGVSEMTAAEVSLTENIGPESVLLLTFKPAVVRK